MLKCNEDWYMHSMNINESTMSKVSIVAKRQT